MATSPQLRIEAVSKRFGGIEAVRNCSFEVAGGSITGVIGPNGAGKSTVFNLISGIEAPDAGTITFEGRTIQGWPSYRIARLGLARTFQIPRELRGLSVLENLMLVPRGQFGERLVALAAFGRRVRREEAAIEAKARSVLATVELSKQAEIAAGQLSGGQKKLLELARCLMTEPKLILLDEPTAGVNPRLIEELMATLRRVHQSGVTLAIIEHNMNVVMRFCEHLVVLERGSVLMDGPPDVVRNDHRVLEAYLGAEA